METQQVRMSSISFMSVSSEALSRVYFGLIWIILDSALDPNCGLPWLSGANSEFDFIHPEVQVLWCMFNGEHNTL